MDSVDASVFIVDDDSLTCEALQCLIESIGLKAVTFADAREFLEQFDPRAAGCLLLDIRMPGMSGLELLDRLTERRARLPIIILTAIGDVAMAVNCMKRGVFDFLEKPCGERVLLDTINRAVARDLQFRRSDEVRRELADRIARLTPRERAVLDLVVSGMPNKKAAQELGVTAKTVEVHRARLMAKVRAGSVAELVRLAYLAEPQKHLPDLILVGDECVAVHHDSRNH